MARRTRVSVFLDWAAINRLPLPGGMVFSWLQGVAAEVYAEAFVTAPRRTGELANSLRMGAGSFNQYGVSARIENTAPHALYVLRGTMGPIRPTSSEWLPVGKSQGLPESMWVYRRQVSGQAPNNFMRDALRSVMVRRGI